MADLIRDAPIGQLIRFLTKNKYLQYPEERADFKLPEPWQQLVDNPNAVVDEGPVTSSSSSTVHGGDGNNNAGNLSEKESDVDPEKQKKREQDQQGAQQ